MEKKKFLDNELQPQDDLQEVKPISQEEFEKRVREVAAANEKKLWEDFEKGILHLRDYSGVRKFKSIRRAIRRGHVSIYGEVYPHRPFKNISTVHNRGGHRVTVKTNTYMKKRYYEQLTHKNRKVA